MKDKLTLDEKLMLLTGRDFWSTNDLSGKIRPLIVSDGPSGLRKNVDGITLPSTAMPTCSTIANTWNLELAYLDAATIASCCVENNVDILLGPGVNIKKSPFCGRNFEYFSEDPILSGEMGKAFINGLQDNGVGACVKHYCCNNYEFLREFRSSEVDERTLFELYLKPFEIALEAKPWSIMPSYNPVNGIYACENQYLLTEILRNKFKYEGYSISDWGAVHNSAKSLKAGLDLRMAYAECALPELKEGIESGYICENDVDVAIHNLEKVLKKCDSKNRKVLFNEQQRHANAVKIAEEGIVLLKNESVLPVNKNDKILICGEYSFNPIIGGGGSSFVESSFKQVGLDKILSDLGYEAEMRFGYNAHTCFDMSVILQRAKQVNKVILTVGVESNYFCEGSDRESIKLSRIQEQFIHAVAKVNPNVIVVIYCGGVVDVSDWENDAKSIILAGYSGEGVNEALAKILIGKVNPSGKLAETFYYDLTNDYIDSINSTDSFIIYNDGIFVGYKNNDKSHVKFPFGFGLSYSKFVYSNLEVKKVDGDQFLVSFNLTNDSDVSGKEVAQLYIGDVSSSVSRPKHELKRFVKIEIQPHETKRIEFLLNLNDFKFYNLNIHDWYLEEGLFNIEIGASSADIKLIETINISVNKFAQYSREK